MAPFDPIAAVAGGLLIGLASTLLLALDGRIAGISGILHDLFRPPRGEIRWRSSFLFGLVLAGVVWVAFSPTAVPTSDAPLGRLAIAGVLVGVGTRMANGCTSGHGVCGLGRRSPRSAVAVGVFLSVAIATTFVVRHLVEASS